MKTNKNEYYFISVEDTIKYGIISAAIIGRVKFWCEHNKKNELKEKFHNDQWWSGFMCSREFSEQLGIPVKTIEKNMAKLLKNGILIKGVFNKRGFDRTGWYRLNPNPQQVSSTTRDVSSDRQGGIVPETMGYCPTDDAGNINSPFPENPELDLKDTTIVSERYNDSIGEIQSISPNGVNGFPLMEEMDFPLESKWISPNGVNGFPPREVTIPVNHLLISESLAVNPAVNPDIYIDVKKDTSVMLGKIEINKTIKKNEMNNESKVELENSGSTKKNDVKNLICRRLNLTQEKFYILVENNFQDYMNKKLLVENQNLIDEYFELSK
jgi:hypothetical protein